MIGVLLVNLGTPRSAQPSEVYRYLIEFLTDERVIDLPWLKRQLLVRGMIVPFRYRQSARAYQQIWTKGGSPLLIYGRQLQEKLQHALGKNFRVELAMRYQEPSIKEGIASLMKEGVQQLIVLPLFPQYASATTGSVHQRVQEELANYNVIPKVTLIDQFTTHPGLIHAFSERAKQYDLNDYDHVLFSFHGLPEKHIKKADRMGRCLKSSDCCAQWSDGNYACYSAQCYASARAIAESIGLSSERYTICFQSRLGKDPWLQPYTSATIHALAKNGKKRVLVFCPAFVCDCLETTYEIGIEYAAEFKQAGGERLDLVEGLNAHPAWISAVASIVRSHITNAYA